MTKAVDAGHCGLPLDELVPLAEALLEIPAATVEVALELELQDGAVVADAVEDRPCVFLAGLHRAERAIAARLRALAEGEPPWPAIDAEKAVPWVEAKVGLALADSQREALCLAATSKVLVITGGPRVGKTTLANAILCVLAAKGVPIGLTAPTGRTAASSVPSYPSRTTDGRWAGATWARKARAP